MSEEFPNQEPLCDQLHYYTVSLDHVFEISRDEADNILGAAGTTTSPVNVSDNNVSHVMYYEQQHGIGRPFVVYRLSLTVDCFCESTIF